MKNLNYLIVICILFALSCSDRSDTKVVESKQTVNLEVLQIEASSRNFYPTLLTYIPVNNGIVIDLRWPYKLSNLDTVVYLRPAYEYIKIDDSQNKLLLELIQSINLKDRNNKGTKYTHFEIYFEFMFSDGNIIEISERFKTKSETSSLLYSLLQVIIENSKETKNIEYFKAYKDAITDTTVNVSI